MWPAPQGKGSNDPVIDGMHRQIERALAAGKTSEDKAALVIPAIGVIAGITGSQISPSAAGNCILITVGLGAATGAIGAACASIRNEVRAISEAVDAMP